MKKITFALVILMLVAFPATAYADGGTTNNPHSFELDMDCEGQTVTVTVPIRHSAAGKVLGGGIAIVHSFYIDFDDDGVFETPDELMWSHLGQGIQTTWCTWRWQDPEYPYYDPYLHGMDIQFVPPQ